MSARRPPGASSASTLAFVDPSASRAGAATTLQTEAKRTGSVSAGVVVGSATTIQVTNDASVVSVRRRDLERVHAGRHRRVEVRFGERNPAGRR